MSVNIFKFIVPIALLIGGGVAAKGVMALAPTTAKQAPESAVVPVDVLVVQSKAAPAVISATGVVSPDQEVTVLPQVAGEVVELSPNLLPGGRFKKGELMARIDARDYKLALRADDSRVRSAELELALEEKRSGIAAREWELLGDDRQRDEVALALRRPQLALAQLNLESARSSRELTNLKLERTKLTAPFNAVVAMENIDVGQVVGAGTQLARLVGTDRFRVMVSVPVEELSLIRVPGLGGEEASTARISQALSDGQHIVRTGQVLRVSGELDAQTRRAQVLVSVESPLDGPEGGLPMLPGAFVNVEIQGRALEGAISVPRALVKQGGQVWVVDENEKLAARQVTILWGDDDVAFLSGEIKAGDRVVTSALNLPISGTAVKVNHSQNAEAL